MYQCLFPVCESVPIYALCSTAVGVDFEGINNRALTFDKDTSSHKVVVSVIDDSAFEEGEQFLLLVSLISGDTSILLSPASATVTIEDDDESPGIYTYKCQVFLNGL